MRTPPTRIYTNALLLLMLAAIFTLMMFVSTYAVEPHPTPADPPPNERSILVEQEAEAPLVEGDVFWHASVAEATKQANGKPLLIWFTAPDCGPCKIFGGRLWATSVQRKWYAARYSMVRLSAASVGSMGNDERFKRWGVTRIPTLVVYEPTLKQSYSLTGCYPALVVHRWLDRVAESIREKKSK